MGYSKSDRYPGSLQLISDCSRALGHPERLSIINLLVEHGALNVEEIIRNSPLSRPSVSNHLKVLREHDFIVPREVFPFIYYELNESIVKNEFLRIIRFYERLFGS